MLVAGVRHLPTAWNRVNRLQGRRDTDVLAMDEAGAAAVRRNRAALESLGPFDCVLASSLKRTQQTAGIYQFARFMVEPLLDELDFGPYEGRERASLEELAPDWVNDPRKLVLGESIVAFEARIREFLDKYSHCRRVLVFGHGSWFRGLLSVARYGDVRAMNTVQVENNELIAVSIEEPADDLRVLK